MQDGCYFLMHCLEDNVFCQVMQPYVGSSLQAACQCLHQLCLYQVFFGGEWADPSHASLAMTSWQGTSSLLGSWGLTLTETGHLGHLLSCFC